MELGQYVGKNKKSNKSLNYPIKFHFKNVYVTSLDTFFFFPFFQVTVKIKSVYVWILLQSELTSIIYIYAFYLFVFFHEL